MPAATGWVSWWFCHGDVAVTYGDALGFVSNLFSISFISILYLDYVNIYNHPEVDWIRKFVTVIVYSIWRFARHFHCLFSPAWHSGGLIDDELVQWIFTWRPPTFGLLWYFSVIIWLQPRWGIMSIQLAYHSMWAWKKHRKGLVAFFHDNSLAFGDLGTMRARPRPIKLVHWEACTYQAESWSRNQNYKNKIKHDEQRYTISTYDEHMIYMCIHIQKNSGT